MSVEAGAIAIIGMAGRFAAAPDIARFWDNILDKVDAVREASDEWSGPYFDPGSSANDRIYTRRGGFLGDSIAFDPLTFGVMPNTVGSGDADHFLAIATAAAALSDAGYKERPFDRGRTGVILGHGTYVNRGYDTLLQHGRVVDQTLALVRRLAPHLDAATLGEVRAAMKANLPPFDATTVPSLVPNIIAGRIANRFDLGGPNFIVDAACASSLIALELAIQELATGRCTMMLTGGVHASTPPQLYMMFCLLNALSRGNVRPFDKGADGTLLGEGLGMLVLKRREDAERDRDHIYALIVGSGVASDGRAVGLLTPREEGQVLALRRAYEGAGLDPATVDLVEAHGTGTPVGDATEVKTLGALFATDAGSPKRALGSVKSMIGHCISAAGAAGVIKTALALHDKILPPTICEEVNADLDCAGASLYVNTESRPWIRATASGPRRAAVDAFGFGGVNAHVILEEYRAEPADAAVLVHARWSSELLAVSADDKAQLLERLDELRTMTKQPDPPALASIASQLARRPAGAARLAFVCRDHAQLRGAIDAAGEALRSPASSGKLKRTDIVLERGEVISAGRIAWLFPGEGSQYRNMLSELCLCFPTVRTWFDLLDEVYGEFDGDAPSRVIFPPPTCITEAEQARLNARLVSFDLGSAAVFTTSMALHELLLRLGCRADALLGHSTGEGAAMVAAGAIRHESRHALIDTMRRFYGTCRDLERSGRIPKGQLISVGAIDAATLQQIVGASAGNVFLALDNCVNQQILFCDEARAQSLTESIHRAGGVCSVMPINRAYHTPLFAHLEEVLGALYDELPITPPRDALYSCATARRFPDDVNAVRELAARQWFSPVRFRETVSSLYEDGVRTFIEIGPGATLTSFVRDTLGKRKALAIATNIPGRSALAQLQRVLAELFVHGRDIDFSALFAHRRIDASDDGRTRGAARSHSTVRVPLTMPTITLPAQFAPGGGCTTADPPASQGAPAKAKLLASHTDAPSVNPVRQASGRVAALQSHFETMQHFLAAQERVMAAAWTSARGAQPSAVAAIAPSTLRSGEDAKRWSWLGRVVERSSTRVKCERVFDVAHDAFLRDHTLGRAISSLDPTLLPLPVLPFTAMMEVLAEASRCLVGAQHAVIAMRDVKGHRWLALDHGRLAVATIATVLKQAHDDRIDVQVTVQPSGGANKLSALLFEGIVTLSPACPAPPAPAMQVLRQPLPSHYTPDMLYADAGTDFIRYAPMFHGHYFRAVERIDAWGDEGIDATLRTRELGAGSAPSSSFQLDPVLLDAAGQLIGYWVAERYGVDLTFFPFSVRHYEQFVDPLPPGRVVACRARIRLASDDAGVRPRFEFVDHSGQAIEAGPAPAGRLEQSMVPSQYETCRIHPASAFLEADFEFADDSGRIIARVQGWRDRYFSIPHAHYRCHLSPQRAFFSEPWAEREMAEGCRCTSAVSWAYLDDGWQIWKRALAHLMLAPSERRHWYSLPESGPRRTEWLLGRITAKDAVRQWFHKHRGLELAPVDIEVLPEARGRPVVRVPALGDSMDCPAVSISHHDGTTVALAFPSTVASGIDVAILGRIDTSDLRSAFTLPEWEALEARDGDRDRARIRAWCAKEAAAKAAGTGLLGAPADWIVSESASRQDLATVTHQGDTYDVSFSGDDEIVIAVAVRESERAQIRAHGRIA